MKRFLLTLLIFSGAVRAQSDLDLTQPRWFGTAQWDADSLGNHRVLLRVDQAATAARAVIPWRRRDVHPEAKAVWVQDCQSGALIGNVRLLSVTRARGDVIFEPVSGPGDYAVYYLPYRSQGSRNYPKVAYCSPVENADVAWLTGLEPPESLPLARIVQFQSIDAFNSFFPMEVIATPEEVNAFVQGQGDRPFLLFPEDRTRSIRMRRDLPLLWVCRGLSDAFEGEAARNEYYAFQVGVFASRASLQNVDVTFTDLEGPGDARIPASALTCTNTQGVDWIGRAFRRPLTVAQGEVQALWMGVDVGRNLPPGVYRGWVTVSAEGAISQRVEIRLTVDESVREDRGDDEPWRLSRLRWLHSRIADDLSVVPPYTPVTIHNRRIGCLGREMELDDLGLPRQITSFFTPEMTAIGSKGRNILAGGMAFRAIGGSGETLKWKSSDLSITPEGEGRVRWASTATAGPLRLALSAFMEFDGCAEFEAVVTADEATTLSDLVLDLPLKKDAARYMLGLGRLGGARPPSFDWAWDASRNQDGLWLGDVNAGVQLSLSDVNYDRPLNTNFYQLKPLNLPPSWSNDGKGGIRFQETGSRVPVQAFSGARTLSPGDTLHFRFRLLITPFKPLDTDAHWANRYYHRYNPIDTIAAAGANVINVHHATAINPYINYPFFVPDAMKAYIDAAHAADMRVKIYYTVRELCNRAPELFALFSLGHEVLSAGPGGGFSWLQEHLEGDYIAGWLVPHLKDAALINSGVSRWHNFYLEGLDWLVRHVGIDGLYIDDVAFDRTVMQRVRRILDRGRPQALIDLHSANQYNPRDGHASSANLYLEHFPYLNRLWFGEYFDYGSAADYWLTEMSGIPFGLMGEMLQDGGNPWRGMVFGMTSRLPWAGDPRPLWKVWDDFGMQGSRMVGWWVEDSPVKTGHPDVLATVYLQKNKALIALASWAKGPLEVKLRLDASKLGFRTIGKRLTAPAIPGFQAGLTFDKGEKIPVQPGKGWLLILE